MPGAVAHFFTSSIKGTRDFLCKPKLCCWEIPQLPPKPTHSPIPSKGSAWWEAAAGPYHSMTMSRHLFPWWIFSYTSRTWTMWGHPEARQWYSTSWRALGLSYRSCGEKAESKVSEEPSSCYQLAPTCTEAQRWAPDEKTFSSQRMRIHHDIFTFSGLFNLLEYRKKKSLGTGRALNDSKEGSWIWDGDRSIWPTSGWEHSKFFLCVCKTFQQRIPLLRIITLPPAPSCWEKRLPGGCSSNPVS